MKSSVLNRFLHLFVRDEMKLPAGEFQRPVIYVDAMKCAFSRRPDLYAPDADASLVLSPADLSGHVFGSIGTGMTCHLRSSTISFRKVRA